MQTYRFYTKKGERLGIFLINGEAESKIEVYRCSLEDQFSKQEARVAHFIRNLTNLERGPVLSILKKKLRYHPEVFNIDKVLTGKEFFSWCNDKYWQLREKERPARYRYLTKIGSKEKILDVKPLFKMGR